MSRPLRDYRAYGLWVRSPIALPFAPFPSPLLPAGEPDVVVRIGATAEALPASAESHRRWECAPGAFLRRTPGVARFLVTGGREIVVEPQGDGDLEVEVILANSIIAVLLMQRGKAVLHAGAVETGMGAVLFAGTSGSGKSSLLAALVERGYAMLADDVTGVMLDAGGGAVALSAFPCMKLRPDTLDELAWQGRKRGRVVRETGKHLVPVERFREEPQAVCAVCLLEGRQREGIEVEAVPTADAFRRLCGHTYRGKYLRGLGQQPAHFGIVAALARRVPVVVVRRPVSTFQLDVLADRIEEWFEELDPQEAAGGNRTRWRRRRPAP